MKTGKQRDKLHFDKTKISHALKKCITTIYCLIEDFCKIYQEWEKQKLLPTSNGERDRKGSLSLAELLTIIIYFYLSPCSDFKNYYLYFLPAKYHGYFKLLP